MTKNETSLKCLWLLIALFCTLGCGKGSESPSQPATQSPPPMSTLKISNPEKGELPYTWGVDLRDIEKYQSPMAAQARAINNDMAQNPQNYFPPDVVYTKAGPGFDKPSQIHTVYGVEFSSAAQNTPLTPQSTEVEIVALIHSDEGVFFRSYLVVLEKGPEFQVKDVSVIGDTPLSQAHFQMKLGVLQRKVILFESKLNIVKIYPIGVGGFDEGVISKGKTGELTPVYTVAKIDRRFAIAERWDPDLYQGRPFIRITAPHDGGYTSFGLHYSISPLLRRGFVSHGCVRMRDKDLYELFTIIENQGSGVIPLEMHYWLKEEEDTPYPLESGYWRVRNFGTAENPVSRTDDEDLTILEHRRTPPPLAGFNDSVPEENSVKPMP